MLILHFQLRSDNLDRGSSCYLMICDCDSVITKLRAETLLQIRYYQVSNAVRSRLLNRDNFWSKEGADWRF